MIAVLWRLTVITGATPEGAERQIERMWGAPRRVWERAPGGVWERFDGTTATGPRPQTALAVLGAYLAWAASADGTAVRPRDVRVLATDLDPWPTGPEIRGIREILGLERSELAVLLRATGKELREWEEGKGEPPARVLGRLHSELLLAQNLVHCVRERIRATPLRPRALIVPDPATYLKDTPAALRTHQWWRRILTRAALAEPDTLIAATPDEAAARGAAIVHAPPPTLGGVPLSRQFQRALADQRFTLRPGILL